MYCASRRHCSNKIRTAWAGPKLLVLNELFHGKKMPTGFKVYFFSSSGRSDMTAAWSFPVSRHLWFWEAQREHARCNKAYLRSHLRPSWRVLQSAKTVSSIGGSEKWLSVSFFYSQNSHPQPLLSSFHIRPQETFSFLVAKSAASLNCFALLNNQTLLYFVVFICKNCTTLIKLLHLKTLTILRNVFIYFLISKV